MTRSLKLILLSLYLAPTVSFAFFCPNNFNQINFGDTISQVDTTCGTPDHKEEKTEDANVPQEWSFYVPQTVAISGNQQAQGTLKATMAFDKDGKLINISVNGIGVGATDLCGTNIGLGATQDAVKGACGTPAFINKQQAAPSAPGKKIVIYTYGAESSVKPIFENGVLTKKE